MTQHPEQIPKQGERVELVRCTDEFTRVQPGDRGTVQFIDSLGTVHVKWDSGRFLGLIPGEDEWLTTAEARELRPGPNSEQFERRYHVPRSQVWQGSRGRQSGNVHLHARKEFISGRIKRRPGQALCGKNGWFEREPYAFEVDICQRCAEIAARPSIEQEGK
jgi:hypothetical protein